MVCKNDKWEHIDKTGNVLVSDEFDFVSSFREGLAPITKDDKWGFIDTTGSIVIPCEYDKVGYFSEGLAESTKGDKCGYIDKNGNLVIPYMFNNVYGTFTNGLAVVQSDDGWGVIDAAGEFILPCDRDRAYGVFEDGLSCVYSEGKYGFADITGNIIIPCQFDDVYLSKFNYGIAKVKIKDKWGFIDTTGEVIISCAYDSASYGEGYFTLLKDGEISIISRDEVQPDWEEELATREQTLTEQAEARRIEAEKQKMLKEYTDKDTIKAAQTALNEAGYDCGKPDGIAGKGTAGAITNYQTDKGLNITGTITHELLISLGVIAE